MLLWLYFLEGGGGGWGEGWFGVCGRVAVSRCSKTLLIMEADLVRMSESPEDVYVVC